MKETAVYSFDIFDTVLVRKWAKPTDLFWELGKQLKQENLIQLSPDSWSELRIETEKNVRSKLTDGEVTIQNIYDYLAPSLKWSKDDAKNALRKEIELERISLQPVPAIKRKIQALHLANERVIYISDIYLPQDVIKLFLQENNIWADSDILYVSSEVEARKSSGKLFWHCLTKESIKPDRLHHIGDNLHSDIKVPKRLGINVRPFTQTHLNRYERQISESDQLPLAFRSLLAGSSRLTRLQCQEDSPHKQLIWETAASVMAPVLFGFVHWCLQEAESKGIQKLYFVARDGQILHKIATILCKNWAYNVECRYLYGSRQAFKFPAIQSLGEYELDWIFDFPQVFLSVFSLCERINIKPEQIRTPLISNGFPEQTWNRNLTFQERTLLKQLFQKESDIFNLVISTAKEYRNKTIGYFRQEGLTDWTSFGFVDFGWKGSLLKSISHLLYSAEIYPEGGIYGFYFALKKRVELLPTDHLFAYFFDVSNPSATRKQLCRFSELFEALVAADHGSTMRFEKTEGKYIPILRSLKNEKALNWGIETYQKAIVKYVENFSSVFEKNKCSSELFLCTAELLLEQFIENPTKEEARIFGSLEHTPDMAEAILYELAPELTFRLCLEMLFNGRDFPSFTWKPAVIVRSKKYLIFMFEKNKFLPQKFKRLKYKLVKRT